jgi:curli biogenesis system outer membrane secretion channel CsgG
MSLYLRSFVFLCAALLAGCSSSADVTRGGGLGIGAAQAERYDGPKARIAVGRIADNTSGENSLASRLGLLLGDDSAMSAQDFLGGVRDLLTTAVFQSGRYIVLEREHLNDVMVEQEFAASHRAGDQTNLPLDQLEGVDLLLVGALTGFDAGENGGIAFPIPVPLGNDRRNWGVVDVEMRTASAMMDLRVIDVATGRIVAAVAVEGKARKFGAAWAGVLSSRHGYVRLPGLLSVFENTPVEKALGNMIDAAMQTLVDKTPAEYYREPSAPPPAP